MATMKYPQVWRPDGTWFASFYTMDDAKKWVTKRTKNEPGWVINYERPEKKTRV